MEQNEEDEEDDCEDDRGNGCTDGEQTNHHNQPDITSSKNLLEGAWINETLGIDLGVCDEEDIISVGNVKE